MIRDSLKALLAETAYFLALKIVTNHNKWAPLDMHFHGDTNASPEDGMLLQFVSRRTRYSNFRQGLA